MYRRDDSLFLSVDLENKALVLYGIDQTNVGYYHSSLLKAGQCSRHAGGVVFRDSNCVSNWVKRVNLRMIPSQNDSKVTSEVSLART